MNSGRRRLATAVLVAALGCNSDEVRQESASNSQGSVTESASESATESASASVTDGTVTASATASEAGSATDSEAGSGSQSESNSGVTESASVTDTTATMSGASVTDTDTGVSATDTGGTVTAGTDSGGTDTAGTDSGETDSAGTDTNGTDSSGDMCMLANGDSACENCLKDNCCDVYLACEGEVGCLCALECTNLVQCTLDCGLNALNLGDLLEFVLGGEDACLLNNCGVVCPVVNLL